MTNKDPYQLKDKSEFNKGRRLSQISEHSNDTSSQSNNGNGTPFSTVKKQIKSDRRNK